MTPHLPWGHGNQPVSRAQQLENPRQYGRDEDADGESDPDLPQHPSGNLSDFEGNDEDGEFESDPEFPNPTPGHHVASSAHAPASAGPAEPYTPRPRKEHMSPEEYKAKVTAAVKEAKDKTQFLRDHVYGDVNLLYPKETQKHLDHRLQQISAWETTMLGPDALGRLPEANREILERNFQFLAQEIGAMSTAMFRLPTVRMFFTLDVKKRRANSNRNPSISNLTRRRKK